MAWQSTKILLMSVEVDEKTGKKVIHRYVKSKSKGTGKNTTNKKLTLKKYNPILRKHVLYKETKYK